MIDYREPLFRPPAEADSLIFQVAYGCPHNACRFCGMYKGVPYQLRNLPEVLKEFAAAAQYYPGTKRIFLADGDVMILPFEQLKLVLEELNRKFPELSRVNVYANGSSISAKSEKQLEILRRLKLNTLYVGLESGDQTLLDAVNKGEQAEIMTAAVQKAQRYGLRCSVMVLLGLAGREGSRAHAEKTAAVLNEMQPRLLSALRFIEVPGTKMFKGYAAVSEYEAVEELRLLVENLELRKTVFRANHASNPVPLGGRFPQDKAELLAQLDHMLGSGRLDRTGPGYVPLFL